MVMILAMIALVLLMIGAAALIRTLDASSLLVGNVAFRRDLTNRAEAGIASARAVLAGGALGDEASRAADNAAFHYFASRQANGSGGVPAVLLDASAYDKQFNAPVASSDGIVLRWVVDRQCAAAGAFTADACDTVVATTADAGGAGNGIPVAGSKRPVYRVSVRVTGPRNTEAFYQATFAD
jgi:hypothetical protein